MARPTCSPSGDPRDRTPVGAEGSPAGSFGRTPAVLATLVLAAVLWTGAGCRGDRPHGDGSDAARSRPDPGADLTVVVSVPPQAFLVEGLTTDVAPEQAGGKGRRPGGRLRRTGATSIQVMVPPGASPRTYEPTLRQMRALSRAEIYLAVGHPNFPFEQAWLDELRQAAPGMRIVDTGARCPLGGGDPHLWLSPTCAREMAAVMAEALAAARPEREAALRRRLVDLQQRIDSVGAVAGKMLEPHRGRAFLVYHPAWGYFAREFGLRQLALEAGGKQPSPHELSLLVRSARQESIQVVFVQPQFTMEPSRTIARTIGAEVEVLNPLDRDWASTVLGAARALDRAFRR